MDWQTCGVTVWMDPLKWRQFEVESLGVFDHQNLNRQKDKRRERSAYSTTGPLTFCGFIKRNYNHISDFLCARLMCPWATRSSPLCLWVHLLKMKAKLLALARPFYFTLRSGPKHLQYPLSEMTFLWHVANDNSKLVLSVERQSAGFTLGSLLNHPFEPYFEDSINAQTVYTVMWVTQYVLCLESISLSLSLWVRIQLSQLSLSCHLSSL